MKKGLFRFSVCLVMAFILVTGTSMAKAFAAPLNFYTSNGTVDITELEKTTTGNYVGIDTKYFRAVFTGNQIPDELSKNLVINEINGTSMVITRESGLNISWRDLVAHPFTTIAKILNAIFGDQDVSRVEYKTVEEFLEAFEITDVAEYIVDSEGEIHHVGDDVEGDRYTVDWYVLKYDNNDKSWHVDGLATLVVPDDDIPEATPAGEEDEETSVDEEPLEDPNEEETVENNFYMVFSIAKADRLDNSYGTTFEGKDKKDYFQIKNVSDNEDEVFDGNSINRYHINVNAEAVYAIMKEVLGSEEDVNVVNETIKDGKAQPIVSYPVLRGSDIESDKLLVEAVLEKMGVISEVNEKARQFITSNSEIKTFLEEKYSDLGVDFSGDDWYIDWYIMKAQKDSIHVDGVIVTKYDLPAEEDPTEEPTEEEPTEDPTEEDPTKEDPTKEDPTKEDPTKEDPTKEDPTKEDPTKEDPTKEDPTKEDPTEEEPTVDPTEEDPTEVDPTEEDPTEEEPTEEEPTEENPSEEQNEESNDEEIIEEEEIPQTAPTTPVEDDVVVEESDEEAETPAEAEDNTETAVKDAEAEQDSTAEETSEEVEEIVEDEIPQNAATEEVQNDTANTTSEADTEEIVEVVDDETPLAATGDNMDVLLIALGAAILSIGVVIFKRR